MARKRKSTQNITTQSTPVKKNFSSAYTSGYSDSSGRYNYRDTLKEITYLGEKYYIAKYGDKNNQPDLWDELEESGGWHRSCLGTRYKFAAGQGLRIEDGGREIQLPIVNSLFQTPYDLNQLATKDQVKYGGYAYEVIWSQDGTTITSVRHIPWRQIRAERMDTLGNIRSYFRSQSWSGGYQYLYDNDDTKERLPVFNPRTATIEPKQILVIRRPNDRSLYYPEPDSAGVVKSALLESQIKRAKLSFSHRAANPAFFLLIPFDTNKQTEDDFQDIVDSIDSQLAGAEHTGQTPVLSYTPGADNRPELIAPPNFENQNAFQEWEEENVSEIFSHHGILFPEVAGRRNENTGLGTEDVQAKFQIFINTGLSDTQRYTTRGIEMILPYLDGISENATIEIVQINPTEGVDNDLETDINEGQNEESIDDTTDELTN